MENGKSKFETGKSKLEIGQPTIEIWAGDLSCAIVTGWEAHQEAIRTSNFDCQVSIVDFPFSSFGTC